MFGKLAPYNVWQAFLICLTGRQFIIVSSSQILIIAYWCGFLRVGPVLLRFRNSRNVHFVSSSRTQFLITTHYYQRVVSILFVYRHWKLWQWKFIRFLMEWIPNICRPYFLDQQLPIISGTIISWSSQLNALPLMESNHWPIMGRIYGICYLLM